MADSGKIVIAGGGIGGLATARALSLAGRRSVVLEQAPEFAEIGAGIQMGPNGFRMLERLGMRDAFDDLAVFPDDLIVMDGISAEEITRIPALCTRTPGRYPPGLARRLCCRSEYRIAPRVYGRRFHQLGSRCERHDAGRPGHRSRCSDRCRWSLVSCQGTDCG